MAYSIAIDGPAGAGKSTIAKRVAKLYICRHRRYVPRDGYIFCGQWH